MNTSIIENISNQTCGCKLRQWTKCIRPVHYVIKVNNRETSTYILSCSVESHYYKLIQQLHVNDNITLYKRDDSDNPQSFYIVNRNINCLMVSNVFRKTFYGPLTNEQDLCIFMESATLKISKMQERFDNYYRFHDSFVSEMTVRLRQIQSSIIPTGNYRLENSMFKIYMRTHLRRLNNLMERKSYTDSVIMPRMAQLLNIDLDSIETD